MARAYTLLALLMMSSSMDYHPKPQWLTVAIKQDRERRLEVVRGEYEHRSCGSQAKAYLAVYRTIGSK